VVALLYLSIRAIPINNNNKMAFLVCFGRGITIHFPFNSVRFFEFSTYHATFDVIFSLFMSRRTFYHGRLIKSNFYEKNINPFGDYYFVHIFYMSKFNFHY